MVWLERLTFKTASVSIATNESYRRIAIERGGMAPDKVFVVRSGPSLDRLKILPPDPALKKGRKYLVGYVGVMGRQEGIDLLLHSVRHIVREKGREDVHFGLVGGGTELKAMQALAQELGVADYVTFTGPRSGRRAAGDAEHRGRVREPGRRERDERQVHDEQDHGVHGAGQGDRAVRPDRRPLLRAGSVAVRPQERSRRHGGQDSLLLDDEDRRRSMGNFGRLRVANELSWDHEVPNLLAAYEAVFEPQKKPAGLEL